MSHDVPAVKKRGREDGASSPGGAHGVTVDAHGPRGVEGGGYGGGGGGAGPVDSDGVLVGVKITLTDSERWLCELLVAVARRFSPGTTVRIVGGWVRDKVLQQRRGGGAERRPPPPRRSSALRATTSMLHWMTATARRLRST